MYIFRLRLQQQDNPPPEIAVEEKNIFDIASVLEASEKVVAYTVTGSAGVLPQELFGYKGLEKWQTVLFPKNDESL